MSSTNESTTLRGDVIDDACASDLLAHLNIRHRLKQDDLGARIGTDHTRISRAMSQQASLTPTQKWALLAAFAEVTRLDLNADFEHCNGDAADELQDMVIAASEGFEQARVGASLDAFIFAYLRGLDAVERLGAEITKKLLARDRGARPRQRSRPVRWPTTSGDGAATTHLHPKAPDPVAGAASPPASASEHRQGTLFHP